MIQKKIYLTTVTLLHCLILSMQSVIRLFNFINEVIHNNHSFQTFHIKDQLLTFPIMLFLNRFFSGVSLFSSSSSFLISSSCLLSYYSLEYSSDYSSSLLLSSSSNTTWPYFFIQFTWKSSMYSFRAHNHFFHSISASALTVIDTVDWMNEFF